MKIKMLKTLQIKSKQLIAQGEEFQARRILEKFTLLDTKTPFQIIEGPFAGEEVPFKLAVILPDEPRPTQQQYDRLSQQNAELLDELEQINAVVGKYDGQLVDAVRKLVQDKSELLQTIERHTDEQLNSEKLLQRIRELETVANGREEMNKYLRAEIQDMRNPVEVPRVVARVLDWYRWNGSDNDEIVGHLAAGTKGPSMDVLRSYVQEGSNGHNLLCALLNGHTVAGKDAAAAMLESVTALVEKWYHAPCANDDKEVLVEQICDFIREREIAAGKAVTI
ncbi:hypothetical protein [Paenibacillus terrae]|uniref:Uncharacterized protein n=1 Tax=Paenibacillus terrae TaxID=159743 RepID=A0A0D7WTH9_9BACL|nr:hypothetical protein [Paenibacillus terrae]KJD42299.1 hypothetical protein QD47_29070 [Paenibacillus terrae]